MLALLFFDIYGASFYRFFTEHRTSLETSSPPATSVHQGNTLTYAVFVLETLNCLLLLAYVSLGASTFVLVSNFKYISLSASYLCLGCKLLAHSVFYALHFCLFSMPYSLFTHHSWCFCMYYAVSETKKSLKRKLCCICNLSAKNRTSIHIHTSYVINLVDCISCCRLELAFMCHEKDSLTYILSVEYMSN